MNANVAVFAGLLGFSVLGHAGCAGQAASAPVPEVEVAAIAWNEWAPEPFERAKRDNKMVLIDVGMEGCTACRWMDEFTYTDPDVIRLVADNFVAIQVDSESRPDVGERYAEWAWPATIFLAPDGTQVFAIRGNKRPPNFVPILKQLITAHKNGELEAGKTEIAVPTADDSELGQIRTRVVAQLDRYFDAERGGWGSKQKVPLGEHVVHALMRAHARGEQIWRDRALLTVDRQLQMIDPVWGGVFVASIGGGWDQIIPEKRTGGQAGALLGFSHAYKLTGDVKYKRGIEGIDKYLRGMMQAPDGTFYASQEDDAPALPDGMNARDYYALGEAERRKYGVPPIDHAVYTDLNGLAITAYVAAYEATGDVQYLEVARKAVDVLIASRQQDAGWFSQVTDNRDVNADKRMRRLSTEVRPYLKPQGPIGLAVLSLARVTGDAKYVAVAKRIAAGMQAEFADPDHGGFFARGPDEMESIAPRRKPVEQNAAAARFLYALGVYTRDDALRKEAERALRSVSHPDVIKNEGRMVGNLVLASELLTTGAVEFSVVGAATDAQARALYDAGRAVFEPRKVLHYEGPGRYPSKGRAAMYICNDEACSVPITDPAKVAGEAAKFAAAGPAVGK